MDDSKVKNLKEFDETHHHDEDEGRRRGEGSAVTWGQFHQRVYAQLLHLQIPKA